ncbi:MAG TPA: transcriptional regulator [Planctomycetaceae bacterium]|nr:transcriptional regulator [Planctomycetaceae bacterium]
MKTSFRNLICIFLTFQCLAGPALAVEDVNVPSMGISDQRPAEGPSVQVDDKYMVPYDLVIPGSEVIVQMVPLPGGVFQMGSQAESESPQVQVQVPPMWVARTETTWREYELYMSMYRLFNSLASKKQRVAEKAGQVDAVTAPTELYDSTFTYEHGQEPELPAVTMTQYAAKQYTKWLSKLTGHQYRLPTEAEWEYACRGGSTSAYSFGDDERELDQYAWFADNSDESPHPVAQKKPNAYGLYDMHGNVMEWTIDNFGDNGYQSLAELPQPLPVMQTVRWPSQIEGRVVRGGSWQDFAADCRCASRLPSDEDSKWKEEDPNLPLSPWWYTNDPTRGLGFRVFRSYQPLSDELMEKFWEIDHQYLAEDVESRLREGRGIVSNVDPGLAQDIKASKP